MSAWIAAGGPAIALMCLPNQRASDIHNEILSRVVDRRMALEEEAQRDDWNGQIVRRLGPRYVHISEMYE